MWKSSRVIFTVWNIAALAILWPVTKWLNGSFPIFTVVWIVIPLIVVWRTKDAGSVGFRGLSGRVLFQTTAINLLGLLMVMLLFEPWAHTYQRLLVLVLASPTPDTTFAWLLRFPRIPALGAMMVYSGCVTLYGEELFFRGWLLQAFQRRMGGIWAVMLQGIMFVIPNLLVAFTLPLIQGVLYLLIYTWLAIGLIGGWAALRTGSIWPSLISATLCNLVLVAMIW